MNTSSEEIEINPRYGAGKFISVFIWLELLTFVICSCGTDDLHPTPLIPTASPVIISPTISQISKPTENNTAIPTLTVVSPITPIPGLTPSPNAFPTKSDSDLFSSLKSGQYLIYGSDEHPGVLYADGQENFTIHVSSRWLSKDTRLLLSPDQKKFVLIGSRSNATSLRIVDLEGGRDQLLMEGTYCPDAAWSPDGTWLVAACYDSLDLFNVRTGKKIELPDECWGLCEGVEWSPDGKWISFQTDNNNIRNPSSKTGIFLVGISCTNQPVNCLVNTPRSLFPLLFYPEPYAWSPDSKYLVISNMTSRTNFDDTIEMSFIDIHTGQVQRTFLIPGYSRYIFFSLDWSPDGKWILFNQESQENKFYKVPVEGGTPIFVTDSPSFIQWMNIP